MSGHDLRTVATVLGLTAVTVLTRAFFFLSNRDGTLPPWADRGLRYAPVAAVAAVIVPEIVTTQGQLITTWMDARPIAALAAAAWYGWRRGVLGTIIVGMAVYLPLHVALGW